MRYDHTERLRPLLTHLRRRLSWCNSPIRGECRPTASGFDAVYAVTYFVPLPSDAVVLNLLQSGARAAACWQSAQILERDSDGWYPPILDCPKEIGSQAGT